MAVQVTGVRAALSDLDLLAEDLEALPEAWREIGDDAAAVVAGLAPHRSGRLAGSVEAIAYQGRAVVTAGSSAVPYAAPINYGWPARHIRPALFLERGAEHIEHKAAEVLETEANKAITRRGFK